MMKVIFFDKRRSTYASVENVVELRSEWSRDKGHLCKIWLVIPEDGFTKAFKQRYYEIERIELQGGTK